MIGDNLDFRSYMIGDNLDLRSYIFCNGLDAEEAPILALKSLSEIA